ALCDATRLSRRYIPRIRSPGGLDEKDMCLLPRHWPMLYAARYHIEIAGTESHRLVAHLDIDVAGQDQEEIVGVVVFVPDEFAFHLRDHDIVFVEGGDGPRLPALGEGAQLFRKGYFVLHLHRPLPLLTIPDSGR